MNKIKNKITIELTEDEAWMLSDYLQHTVVHNSEESEAIITDNVLRCMSDINAKIFEKYDI